MLGYNGGLGAKNNNNRHVQVARGLRLTLVSEGSLCVIVCVVDVTYWICAKVVFSDLVGSVGEGAPVRGRLYCGSDPIVLIRTTASITIPISMNVAIPSVKTTQ